MGQLKAIETIYKGYRFRSRLEARWAVFFDALGIQWEYEKEGFDLGDAGCYLPDFWLKTLNMWAEIKPEEFTSDEKMKLRALAKQSGYSCLMLDGVPGWRVYFGWELYTDIDGDAQEWADGFAVSVEEWLFMARYIHSEHRLYSFPSEADLECGPDEVVNAAIVAARSARFEHGESGGS